ncbi:MAG: YeaC family protein [Candidatus Saccharibacteria bacterium]|nr:YeaC family protein [Moraxellaceae bacterium]
MNPEAVLAALTPEIVDRLRTAVEIGKWPNGERLTAEQRATSMQAVLIWEMKNLPENQRTGYIDKGKKEGEACDTDHQHGSSQSHADEEKPLRFV